MEAAVDSEQWDAVEEVEEDEQEEVRWRRARRGDVIDEEEEDGWVDDESGSWEGGTVTKDEREKSGE